MSTGVGGELMAFVPGIDISEHQRAVDGQALAAAGIKHAVVRCADAITNRLDHFYVQNMASLRAAGVPCDTYVYVRPSLESAASAAERYARWANAVDRPGRLWLDFEGDPGLAPMDLALWSLELVAHLELDGWVNQLGIYTNTWWDAHVDRRADELARLPLWHASYPFSERPPPPPDQWSAWVAGRPPRIARPWRDINADWSLWQFTSSGTLVPGHRLDCNLVDPVLLDKAKPPMPQEIDVPICIPAWATVVNGRVQHYELVEGRALIGWGCKINDPAIPEDRHPLGIQGPDGFVLNLTAAVTGGDAGPFVGPALFRDGTMVVVSHGAATYAFPTDAHDPVPPAPPDTPALAVDVDGIVAAAVTASRQDIAGRLTT